MDNFNITVDDKALCGLLSRLGEVIGNLRPALDEAGEELKGRIWRQFDMQEAPGGGKWKPWSKRTRQMRLKHGKGEAGGILVQEGNLRSSINHRTYAFSAVVGAGLTGSGGKTGHYAAIHQFGGMAGRGRKVGIPARPYMLNASGEVPVPWMEAVRQLLLEHLAKASR